MQKINSKSARSRLRVFRTLAVLMFVAAAISANQGDHQAREHSGTILDPVTEGGQDPQRDKDPKAFVPTEKLAADRAVAFPTDI